MVRKTKAEALATKKKILEAAINVFFEKGVSNSTLDEIAQAADVTRGAIYWHYKNKLSLFTAINDDVHTSLLDEIEKKESVSDNLLATHQEFCIDLFRRMREEPLFFKTMSIFSIHCDYSGELAPFLEEQKVKTREAFDYISRAFTEAQERGHANFRIPPDLAAKSYYCFVDGLILCVLRDATLFSEKEIETLVSEFIQGMLKKS